MKQRIKHCNVYRIDFYTMYIGDVIPDLENLKQTNIGIDKKVNVVKMNFHFE